VIQFDRTPCHFSGHRKWFLCPRCGKRVAVLYGAGKYFLCRHGYDLCYTSQQETEIDRMMRKKRKIRDRLGASHNLSMPIWRKPKGMHWKTFDRLQDQEEEINKVKWANKEPIWDGLLRSGSFYWAPPLYVARTFGSCFFTPQFSNRNIFFRNHKIGFYLLHSLWYK